ncbi:MAG: hypothetical protein RL885_04990 [Planctomycetota bacterium]
MRWSKLLVQFSLIMLGLVACEEQGSDSEVESPDPLDALYFLNNCDLDLVDSTLRPVGSNPPGVVLPPTPAPPNPEANDLKIQYGVPNYGGNLLEVFFTQVPEDMVLKSGGGEAVMEAGKRYVLEVLGFGGGSGTSGSGFLREFGMHSPQQPQFPNIALDAYPIGQRPASKPLVASYALQSEAGILLHFYGRRCKFVIDTASSQ